MQFTRNRVEKELDTYPWDIVGSELCNMTTSMFTANFDLASSNGTENEVALNMCIETGAAAIALARGRGRQDVCTLRSRTGWSMQRPVDLIHDTPPGTHAGREGQCLRNGNHTWVEFRRGIAGKGVPLGRADGLGLVDPIPHDGH